MSQPYVETIYGEVLKRSAPSYHHELICERLHQCVYASVANLTSTRLLIPRSEIRLGADTVVCPDLALLAVPTGKLWLAVEIISSDDHRPDTVLKKQIYEELKLPRLWIIDPRYENVEVYHGSQYGLILKYMLAGYDVLAEKLLPKFQLGVASLFGPVQSQS